MDNILYEESLLMQEGVVAALKNGHNTFSQVMYDSRRKNIVNSGVPDNLIPDWLKDNHSLGSLMIWLVNFDAFADNRIGFVYATMRPLLNYLQAQTAESDLYEMLYSIQNILVKIATSGYNPVTDKEYKKLREELRKATVLKDILPEIVVLHRDLMEFWQFIKYKVPTYKGRREYIYDQFKPALESVERKGVSPIEYSAEEMLKSHGVDYVTDVWNKMLDRKNTDNEGAITASRSLIETVCKYILDERNVTYDEKADLPALYKAVAKELNLSPDQHTEQIFKQILGGCQTVVEGLGALRNAYGDAHGKRLIRKKPNKRHSDLAINLAGTMAMFLLETFENVKSIVEPTPE